MRLAFTYIVSLILFSNSLMLTITYGWYKLNIESFIEQLCENKDKPALECNGKCFLTKISDDSSSDSKSNIPKIERQELLYYQATNIFEILHSPLKLKEANFYYHEVDTNSYTISIFHPPRYS
ncbi:hypothetical protein [Gillisia sp. Hel_I_29]|nr:hypothetical protein [Gillisia sp. Hel_I_29]